jgi:hypothetical protein
VYCRYSTAIDDDARSAPHGIAIKKKETALARVFTTRHRINLKFKVRAIIYRQYTELFRAVAMLFYIG